MVNVGPFEEGSVQTPMIYGPLDSKMVRAAPPAPLSLYCPPARARLVLAPCLRNILLWCVCVCVCVCVLFCFFNGAVCGTLASALLGPGGGLRPFVRAGAFRVCRTNPRCAARAACG